MWACPVATQLVGGGVGRPGQDLGQRCPAGRRGAGDVVGVHDVQHAFQRAQDLVPARQVHGQLVHQSAEGDQTSCCSSQTVSVQLGDGDSAQAVLRLRCPAVALSPYGVAAKRPALRHVGVGCRLDVEVDGHAAAQQLQRDVLVARRDGLDDGAVRAPGDAFALEARELAAEPQVHQDLHRGVRRRFPRRPAPRPAAAATWCSTAGPRRRRVPGARTPAAGPPKPARVRPGTSQLLSVSGSAARVDGGGDPVADKAVQPDFREPAVVVQCDTSLALSWSGLTGFRPSDGRHDQLASRQFSGR